MIAIDSPVLVDLLADGPMADAAEDSLRRSLSVGPVVVCDVVAEHGLTDRTPAPVDEPV